MQQKGVSYSAMTQQLAVTNTMGTHVPEEHGHADGVTQLFKNLVHSDSMDIQNDPRFFTGNVIDKRLAAFSGLAVVSSLMVGTALGECFGMKKDIDLSTIDGICQTVGFVMMNIVLFANVFAAYVGVSQIYFTYRLMTAGPTGFEMASSFYLNPNIAFWRHAAVKKMLLSLPLFLMASAFRILVKFDEDMPNPGATTTHLPSVLPWYQARISHVSVFALACFGGWFGTALLLFYVNRKHLAVFQERYGLARERTQPLLSQIRQMSSRGNVPDI